MRIKFKVIFFIFLMWASFCSFSQAIPTNPPPGVSNIEVFFYPDNLPIYGLTNWTYYWTPFIQGITPTNNPAGGTVSNVDYVSWAIFENSNYSNYLAAYNAQQTFINSNLFSFLSSYTNIGAGIIDSSNRINTMSNLWQSIKSGTNSQAQLTTIQATMAQYDYINWVYMNNIVTLLQRLFPALQQIYQPQNDPAGH